MKKINSILLLLAVFVTILSSCALEQTAYSNGDDLVLSEWKRNSTIMNDVDILVDSIQNQSVIPEPNEIISSDYGAVATVTTSNNSISRSITLEDPMLKYSVEALPIEIYPSVGQNSLARANEIENPGIKPISAAASDANEKKMDAFSLVGFITGITGLLILATSSELLQSFLAQLV